MLAFLVAGLFWLATINVWVEVSLAQENGQSQNQGQPGQVQVCKYDSELDGLLCGEWVDIDTLPETAVPELNCPYGIYWDEDVGAFRCKPRCYYIVLVGWFCHCEQTPKPSCSCGTAVWKNCNWKCPDRPAAPTDCKYGDPTWSNCKWQCPTPTPTPTPPDPPPPPCECGKATKVNGKWQCPARPAAPTDCKYGDPTWSNCKWQCPLPPPRPSCECGREAQWENGAWQCPGRPEKPRCQHGTAFWKDCKWQCPLPPTPTTPTLSVTAGNNITEGGNATFTITASPAPASTLTANISVSQRGDYAASGTTGAKTVAIPTAGSASYSVTTIDDSVDEPDGSITLTLNAGSGYRLSAQASASVGVSDDDLPALIPPSGLKLAPHKDGLILTYDRDASAKRRFRFDLYHSTSDPGDVSAKTIALNDTAYRERQFLREEAKDKATFPDLPAGWYYAVGRTCRTDARDATCGSTHAISPVLLLRDAVLIAPSQTVLAEPNEKADERDVTFRLSYFGGAPSGGATVQLALSGTAVQGYDYNFPGQVTLAAGESEKTLSLRVLTDQALEADETLGVAIRSIEGNPKNVRYSKTPHELTITDLADPLLLADDDPKQLVFTASGPGPHRLRLRLQTSWGLPDSAGIYEFAERSFTLQALSYAGHDPAAHAAAPVSALATVNASHDSDTALYGPGDSRVVPATGDLEAYVYLNNGRAYWREGANPYDHRYLEIVLKKQPRFRTHDHYRLTLAKPDFAIAELPQLTRDSDGDYQLKLVLYNAESHDSGSRDSATSIYTYCHDRVTSSLPATLTFAELRGKDAHLLDGHDDKTFNIPVLCPRGAYSSSDQVKAAAQLVDGQHRGPLLHGTGFKGPDREDTLWAPQDDLAGGLSMVTPAACTISFILPLQKNGRPDAVPAASTTGHCAEDGAALNEPWQQGSPLAPGVKDSDGPNYFLGTTELHPLKSRGGALDPDHAKCRVYTAKNWYTTAPNCRRGDQSYATIKRAASGISDYSLPSGKDNPYPKRVTTSNIVRPKDQNFSGEEDLEIKYFRTGNTSFQIVGARPPNPDPNAKEILHKVGVTTGWTQGELANVNDPDETCPGGRLGGLDNVHDDGYHECRSEASYVGMPGDSGAPVFIEQDDPATSSVTEVLLVGVHYGGELEGASREFAQFIPIDRIYAEALINGYDWDANWLRPLPQLDERGETLTVNRSIGTARAVFDKKDFSLSPAIVYEVGLFRRLKGGWRSSPVAIATITHKDPVAEFTGLAISDDSKGSDYRAQVRMNAKLVTGNRSLDELDHRGGWGPASTVTAQMISYPEKLALNAPAELNKGKSGMVKISATTLAPGSGYRLEIASENQNAAFDEACSVYEMRVNLPEGAQSYQKDVELHGCKRGQLQVSADLSRDNLLVAAESGSGEVNQPLEMVVEGLSNLPRGSVRKLTVNLSGLEPGGTKYLALVALGGSRFRGCVNPVALNTVPSDASTYKAEFDLHACRTGASTLKVSFLHDGKVLTWEEHRFQVLDQVLALGDPPQRVTAGQEFDLATQTRNLDPKAAYQLSVSADGKVVGFGGSCGTSATVNIPAGSGSFDGTLNLTACAAGQGTVKVDLVSAGRTLKSASGSITVAAA